MAAPIHPRGAKAEKPWREAIQRAVKRRLEGEGKPQALDQLADKVVALGLAGDMQAAKEIGDRLDGKPVQGIQHAGEDGGPIVTEIRNVIVDPRNPDA